MAAAAVYYLLCKTTTFIILYIFDHYANSQSWFLYLFLEWSVMDPKSMLTKTSVAIYHFCNQHLFEET
jgi:hypothetical protein